MDSFFALVQKNVLNRRGCDSRDELRIASSPGSSAPTTGGAANLPSAD
jgi:hypothetical protein